MDEIEIAMRINAMFSHQPAQRGAMAAPVIIADFMRPLCIDLETIFDIERDAIAHLLHDIMFGRIERQIKVENPSVDMIEIGKERC